MPTLDKLPNPSGSRYLIVLDVDDDLLAKTRRRGIPWRGEAVTIGAAWVAAAELSNRVECDVLVVLDETRQAVGRYVFATDEATSLEVAP